METTMNIHADILTRIARAARFHGISRSEMILVLIKKMMDDIPEPGRMGTMVRYQKRRDRGDWRRLHVLLKEDDYEYLLDLRKLLKMSVSLILAYAVDKYLDIVIKQKITDNYQFKHYAIIKEIIECIICWKLYWGDPPGNPQT